MYRYKLVQTKDGMDKEKPKKWYAISVSERAQDRRGAMRDAAVNTTISPMELESVLKLLSNYAAEPLLQGHIVRMGEMGSLRITFKSEGVQEAEEFDANSMIRNPRIVFKPSKEFCNKILKKLRHQNAGVLADGVSYGSLADYKKAKG